MKKVLIVILVILIAIFLIKTLSNEDAWICVDGEWVKHGVPSTPKPTTPCVATDNPEYSEVTGIVSLKGELLCPCFFVDNLEVWYDLVEGKPATDVSDINNGDFVTVKGEYVDTRFWIAEISEVPECPEDSGDVECQG